MAAPSRTPASGVDQWTETDQEIIESLLMVDGSARNQPTTHAAHTTGATASRSTIPILAEPPPRGAHALVTPPSSVYAMPASQPPTVVPVAFWVPTPPAQAYYAHPYHPVQPTYFATSGVPRQSAVDMELQEILSEEERKAKHREVQRRFIQRKKEQMDRIRREAATLEKRHSYLKLSMEQLSLEKQNGELQEQIDDAGELQIPSDEEILLVLQEECNAAQKAYVPIDENEFGELLHETMENVNEAIIKDPRKLDDRTKVQVMGWTGRRVLEPLGDDKAAMRFEIAKQFTRLKPTAIAARAWAEISNVDQYQRFFNASMLMKVVKLQHVNDDAIVLFKTIFNPRTAAIQHSVDLLCRIELNDEIVIISRDISMPAVRTALPDPLGWCRSLNVVGFSSIAPNGATTPSGVASQRGDGVAFRYNCCIQGASEASLRYWLMEILFVMVRFETTLVAPLFTLAAP